MADSLSGGPLSAALPVAQSALVARRHDYTGPRCTMTTRTGEPCRAGATAKSGYKACPFHGESFTSLEREAWRMKGAAVTAGHGTLPELPDPSLRTPDDVSTFLELVAGHVGRGQLTPAIGAVLTGIAQAALRSFDLSIFRKLTELESAVLQHAKRAPAIEVEVVK